MEKIKKYQDLIAILIFGAITLVFFWSVIFQGNVPLPTDLVHDYLLDQPRQGENPLIRDSVVQMYPNIDFVFNGYKNLEFPQYNPYILGGLNTLATGQSTSLSPLNLFIPFFNSSLSFFSFLVIFYFLFSGLAFFWFLRTLKYSPAISLLGGIIWQLSGPLIVWQSWATIVGVICWLPLMLLSLHQFFGSKKINWLILFTLANFLSLTSGHLQFYLFSFGTALLYGLYLAIKKRPQKLFILTGFILINVIFMALIIWPFLSNISASHRVQIVDSNHLSYKHLVQFVLPNFWGDHLTYKAPLNYVETSLYIGLIPLVLLFFALLKFKKEFWKKNIFWLSLLIILTLYNFFPVIFKPIYLLFPFLNSFPPFRSLFLVDLCLIMLSINYLASLKLKNLLIGALIIITLITQGLVFYNFNPQQSKDPILNPPACVIFLQEQAINQPLIYSELCPLNLYSLYNIRSVFGYDTAYSEEYYQNIADHSKIISHRNILNAKIKDLNFLRELKVDYIVSQREWPLESVFYQDTIHIYKLTQD